MDQRMNQDAAHMATNLFAPSTNLDSLIGSILLAINTQVEGDESQAGLSLAAWHQWLDDEGYPIDDAIQLFCSELAASYGTDLMDLKSEVADHLDDPHGLTVLSGIIDALPPPIADSCHQLAERSIVTAQDAYAVAGGTRAAVIGGSIAGVFVIGLVGTGIYLKKRSDNRAHRAGELRDDVQGAFRHTEAKVEQKAEQIYRRVQSSGNQEIRQAFSSPDKAKVDVLRIPAVRHGSDFDNLTLELKKDAKSLAKSEVKFHVEHYSEALAEESLGFMEKNDKEAFKALMDDFVAHYKVGLLREEGHRIVPKADEYGKYVVLDKFDPVKENVFGRYDPANVKSFRDYPHIDQKAEQAARARIKSIFVDQYKTILADSFEVAKRSENAEAKRIQLSFGDAYHNARQAARDDLADLTDLETREEARIRKACRDAERAVEDEVLMVFE